MKNSLRRISFTSSNGNRLSTLDKFHTVVSERIFGLRPLVAGSTTSVYTGTFDGRAAVVKIWTREGKPGELSLAPLNNYVAATFLETKHRLLELGVPEVLFSMLELLSGDVIVLPIGAQFYPKSQEFAVIRNHLTVFEDISEGRSAHVIPLQGRTELVNGRLVGLQRDIRFLEGFVEPAGRNNFEYEIFDGSFLVQRRDGRERIVLANVDNLPRLTVPGIPIVTE